MERLTKIEKERILKLFTSSDENNKTIAYEMSKAYLKAYPNEKQFKRKVSNMLKVSTSYSKYWSNYAEGIAKEKQKYSDNLHEFYLKYKQNNKL